MSDCERPVGGLDKRLARHASAQDAQAAKLGRAIDDSHAQAFAMSRACSGITGTAAADDDEIEMGVTHES